MYSLKEPIQDVQRKFLKSSRTIIICQQMNYIKFFIHALLPSDQNNNINQ